MKKSIAFYCCTNGLGHYKRVNEICKYLTDDFTVTVYCTSKQLTKLGPVNNVAYIIVEDNINWNLVNQGETQTAVQLYFDWLTKYGPTVNQYDIVVSDNIVGLLKFRNNIILCGSFLWKDVFNSKVGENSLSSHDEELLQLHKPILITNKYVETQSVKQYPNKIQFGFGCDSQRSIFSDIQHNLVNTSSLNYLPSYSAFIDKLKVESKLAFIDDFSYIDNTRMFARPGVGTITHCVENNIPLIALFDEADSQEIIELAQVVEDLRLGFKQNVNEPFDTVKFNTMRSNSSILYGPKLELQAYKNIAEYFKQL